VPLKRIFPSPYARLRPPPPTYTHTLPPSVRGDHKIASADYRRNIAWPYFTGRFSFSNVNNSSLPSPRAFTQPRIYQFFGNSLPYANSIFPQVGRPAAKAPISYSKSALFARPGHVPRFAISMKIDDRGNCALQATIDIIST
jgi:hypothetical protein